MREPVSRPVRSSNGFSSLPEPSVLTHAVALASSAAADRSGDEDRTVPRYRFRGIASVLVDRLAAERCLLDQLCGTPALIESVPAAIVRGLVAIGIADPAVRSSSA